MTTEDKNNAALRKDAELVKNFQAMRGENQKKEKKREKTNPMYGMRWRPLSRYLRFRWEL